MHESIHMYLKEQGRDRSRKRYWTYAFQMNRLSLFLEILYLNFSISLQFSKLAVKHYLVNIYCEYPIKEETEFVFE